MLNFYSVSLVDNKKSIEKCLINLRKIYNKKFNYTIICPKQSCISFANIAKNNNVKIIDEETIISFAKFRELVLDISKNISKRKKKRIKVNEKRIGWYYQQVLKLSYLLNESKSQPITMIDADTVVLGRIDFYKGENSNLFATYYEKHKPYWETLNTIFGKKIPFSSWISTTCQLNSLTPAENQALINKLEGFISKGNLSMAEWISKIILTAVISTHNKLDDSLISEQDLIGYFLSYYYKQIPKEILFLRDSVSFKLSLVQENIASFLGFKHITYESWLINNKKRNNVLLWLNFIFLIFFSFLKPLIRKRLNN